VREFDQTVSGGLRIERAENGWIVFSGLCMGAHPTTHIARTPKELADLVMTLAQAQADLPTHPPRQP
jgi:hypothetical protein